MPENEDLPSDEDYPANPPAISEIVQRVVGHANRRPNSAPKPPRIIRNDTALEGVIELFIHNEWVVDEEIETLTYSTTAGAQGHIKYHKEKLIQRKGNIPMPHHRRIVTDDFSEDLTYKLSPPHVQELFIIETVSCTPHP